MVHAKSRSHFLFLVINAVHPDGLHEAHKKQKTTRNVYPHEINGKGIPVIGMIRRFIPTF